MYFESEKAWPTASRQYRENLTALEQGSLLLRQAGAQHATRQHRTEKIRLFSGFRRESLPDHAATNSPALLRIETRGQAHLHSRSSSPHGIGAKCEGGFQPGRQ